MTIALRRGETTDDVRAGIAPIWHYFGLAPTAEAVANFAELMTPARMILAQDGENTVGGCGSFPFRLTVPGGDVACCGVSMVGVMPTHRRRGILHAMVDRLLADCRSRGEPVAYLWASEERIYGRYGFGLTGLSADIHLSRDHSAALVQAAPFDGTMRRLTLDAALAPARAIYAEVADRTPGAFARSDEWWRRKVLADPPWRRRGGGEMQYIVLETAGSPVGYALYRVNMNVERGIPTGTVEVIEAVGTSPAATDAIWRYLLDMDWTAAITANFLSTDHPLILSVAEPRRLNLRYRDGAWLRIVDLEAAMAARTFGPGAVTIEIEDAAFPQNAGCWLFREGGAVRTRGAADLRCDIAALASVYLGGFLWRQLVASSRASARDDGAVLRADRVFETRGAPWCPEIF